MIRTHAFPCKLNRTEADTLNRESGRLYTQTLVWHYRIYRRKGIWLSPSASERLGDALSDTSLHAHSRDAAQPSFYKACQTAKAHRGIGGKYPHQRKFYRTTVWKSTGLRLQDSQLRLARVRGLEPITVELPNPLKHLPATAFLEMRLVYNQSSRHYEWHIVVEDGLLPKTPTGEKTLAIDLGEIHPMAVANEQGQVLIVTARQLRSLNRYRNKRLGAFSRQQATKVQRSRSWKRLQRRKNKFLAKNERQRRDIEHKITRTVVNHAVSEKARRVVMGDIRDIADGKRLNRKNQQKISDWSHGKQAQYLSYKLSAEGILLERQSEAYSSQTCPKCGALHKPQGRNYRCPQCGLVAPRDSVGACNQESKILFNEFGHIAPISTKYLRCFNNRSSRVDTAQVARVDNGHKSLEAAAL
jgi:putative transposase